MHHSNVPDISLWFLCFSSCFLWYCWKTTQSVVFFYPWIKTETQLCPEDKWGWQLAEKEKVSFNLGLRCNLSGLIRAKHHPKHQEKMLCWYSSKVQSFKVWRMTCKYVFKFNVLHNGFVKIIHQPSLIFTSDFTQYPYLPSFAETNKTCLDHNVSKAIWMCAQQHTYKYTCHDNVESKNTAHLMSVWALRCPRLHLNTILQHWAYCRMCRFLVMY